MGLREFRGGRKISGHVPGQQVLDPAERMMRPFIEIAWKTHEAVGGMRTPAGGTDLRARKKGRSEERPFSDLMPAIT
jgi:hypothetical protein